MSKAGIALLGADQLKRALQLAKPKTQARFKVAIQKNTKAIAVKAKAAAPKVTGEMASTIRDEYTNDGMVGLVKVGEGKLPRRSKAKTAAGQKRAKARKRKVGKGAYAPVVERGDPKRKHKPHPFLVPSFSSQKSTAISDMTHALNDTVKEI